MLRKPNNEKINQNPLSKEARSIEIKKAKDLANEQKFNNKPAKFIKNGVSGKNLKNGR